MDAVDRMAQVQRASAERACLAPGQKNAPAGGAWVERTAFDEGNEGDIRRALRSLLLH
jgi:hypothetical protein